MVAVVLFVASRLCAQNWSPKLAEKIITAVKTVYPSGTLDFKAIPLQGSKSQNLAVRSEGFYKIYSGDQHLGILYAGQAESMKNVFDFIVVFDKELTIKRAKVLIYREQHGNQIGTVRWLSQFEGKKAGTALALNKEIDGISGATISATNMTNAVSEVLKALLQLSKNGIL